MTSHLKANNRKVYRNPIGITITLNLNKHQAWELLWRPEGQHRWLGLQSCIDLRKDSRVNFVDQSALWRAGIIQLIKDFGDGHYLASFKIFMAPEWHEQGHTALLIEVEEVSITKRCSSPSGSILRAPPASVSPLPCSHITISGACRMSGSHGPATPLLQRPTYGLAIRRTKTAESPSYSNSTRNAKSPLRSSPGAPAYAWPMV